MDLRAFLDPLKPGEYFDCGEARLFGIDEALEAEALRRGRAVGADQFQLVATDGGLIFCRASIMFAIAARWKDLTICRPEDGTNTGEAVLPITWPTHGDLQFTVSRRLGSNIFRRWLQIQAQATRRSQVEQDARFERSRVLDSTAVNGHPNGDGNGHSHREANGHPSGGAGPKRVDAVDLREVAEVNGNGNGAGGGNGQGSDLHVVKRAVDPLATIDAAVVDEWVDDRVPHPATAFNSTAFNSTAFDSTSAEVENGAGRSRPLVSDDDEPTADPITGGGNAVRFEVRSNPDRGSYAPETGGDPSATHFMKRTLNGTDIFPDGEAGLRGDERGERGDGANGGPAQPDRSRSVPVPEISGARLHGAQAGEVAVAPRLDIRSTLLAGRRDSEWVELLRERQVLILGVVTMLALALIAVIGFLSGGGDETSTEAGPRSPATAEAGADTGAVARSDLGLVASDGLGGSSTTVPSSQGGSNDAVAGAPIDSTAPTLRVSSTSVQICHSNYGGCVPVAADVDCEGDGDGPAFQATPVAVFGDDVYDLDTDDDREACEPDQPRLEGSAPGG